MKYPPWGRVSAAAGVAPEALEECEHSSKGYERRVCVVDQVTLPLSIPFSRFQHSFQLIRWSPPSLDSPNGSMIMRGGLFDTWDFTIGGSRFIRGYGLSRGVRGAPEP